MIIGTFDTSQQPMLIAEIGNNHEGDAVLALEMAHAALDAGAHVVKFQIIDPAHLVNQADSARIAQLSAYQLPMETFADIAEMVRTRGGLFMASVFDMQSLASISTHLDAIKIASGDLNFTPLIASVAEIGKPVVLSTGMSSLDEVKVAVETFAAHFPAPERIKQSLAILHCVSLYPTLLEQANLSAVNTLIDAFDVTIGYSDHTLGIEAAIVAVALGARVIEKHFTLDKERTTFRDHALSADQRDFKRLSEIMRISEAMIGTGSRTEVMDDIATRIAARRSIVCARDLPAGSVLTIADLDFVRPANGFPPTSVDQIVGRILKSSCKEHHVLRESDLF